MQIRLILTIQSPVTAARLACVSFVYWKADMLINKIAIICVFRSPESDQFQDLQVQCGFRQVIVLAPESADSGHCHNSSQTYYQRQFHYATIPLWWSLAFTASLWIAPHTPFHVCQQALETSSVRLVIMCLLPLWAGSLGKLKSTLKQIVPSNNHYMYYQTSHVLCIHTTVRFRHAVPHLIQKVNFKVFKCKSESHTFTNVSWWYAN